MADKNIRKYLLDIDTSIKRVNDFLGDEPREFEKFAGNILLRQAIERNIEIMGEEAFFSKKILIFAMSTKMV